MKTLQLPKFGIEHLQFIDTDVPAPGPGEVLVRFGAASVNYRDYQIVTGEFAPNQPLPLVPGSDGAGEVVDIGAGVTRFAVGDRVAPLFFPNWISGEALGDERAVSSGLEAPGVLRQFGAYPESQVAKVAAHLSDAEASCFPCAGLTAWTSLVTAGIGPGDWVLVQGTGGVAIFGLQFARALGARVIATSGSDAKLQRALKLGAESGINYRDTPDWGGRAVELTGGRGVDAVLEIGGTGTLGQSMRAIRRGGHINVIGYLAGIDLGLTVFDLIMKNANLHGMSVGNRDGFEAMMEFVGRHGIRPVIDRRFPFADAAHALRAIADGGHFGKWVIDIDK